MAISTRIIRSKIKAVSNIKKITKAMELVAASKMRRAVARALGTREYAEAALNLLVNISKERNTDHLLLRPGKGEKRLLVITASDKGLCGGFNVSVQRAAREYFKKHVGDHEISAITVGKRSEKIAKNLGLPIIGTFTYLPDHLKVEDSTGISRLILDEFKTGAYKKVMLLYTKYVSAIQQKPILREILPVHADIIRDMIEEIPTEKKHSVATRSMAQYLFEPDDSEVLELVLPRLLEMSVYQGLLESLASEHSARMVAMKNATDSANELVDDLTLTYNNARQSSITQEISEIAAGANAL
jgi:F-type H+-transporting ATPase subunit gamma